MAEARCVLPPPGAPMRIRLAPLSIQGLGDHRHHVEVEAVECLSGQQLRLGEVTRETATVTLGDLVFGERGEEACRGPTFLVRPLGKGRPILLDRGQTEVVEHQRQPGTVDALGHAALGHAASPPLRAPGRAMSVPSSAS
jgi:hypothetical protein